MPTSMKLTDVTENLWLDKAEYGAGDLGVAGFSITKRTLRGGISDGVDEIIIDNGKLKVSVLPTRGMGIWKAWLGDWAIGWDSPNRGPVHPKYVQFSESNGLGWLDGFDELMVRCGLESNGAPEFDDTGKIAYPLHGRIANRPAQKVWIEADPAAKAVHVIGEVEETRFHFHKLKLTAKLTMKAGEPSFTLHDEITNMSGTEATAQMLYHTNFGAGLLEAGAQVVAPIKTLVPRNAHAASGIGHWETYMEPQAGFEEQVYFADLHADASNNTSVMLKNGSGTRAARINYNVKQLPCYSTWKNTTSLTDGYVTGIEPGTNFPNPRTYEAEQQRVVKLAGGSSQKFDVEFEFLDDKASVENAEKETLAFAKGVAPKVYDKPQKGWCADA